MSSSGADAELAALEAEITGCRHCPRLVAWREEVALVKRAAYAHETYWGRPVPGFGDPAATIVVLGLAPGAHGANRTGRMFTGDRSGEWLYRALWRAGLASRPESVSRDDGLELYGCWITGAVRCAPPANKPTTEERDACAPWLAQELTLLPAAGVIVCLGSFAWEAALRHFGSPRPKPKFTHGAEVEVSAPDRTVTLLASYHVSQQNTFTGKLTEPMLDAVFTRACVLSGRI